MKHDDHKCSGSETFPIPGVLDGNQTTNFQNCKDWCDVRVDCIGFVRNELNKCYFKKEGCLTNIVAENNTDLYVKEGTDTSHLSSVGM